MLLAGGSVVLRPSMCPFVSATPFDAIIGPGQADFTVVARHLITVVVMLLCVRLMQWVMDVLNNKITYNVVRDMRARHLIELLVLPFSYLDSHSQGDVIYRGHGNADQFADGLLMGFSQLFTGVVTIIGTLAFTVYQCVDHPGGGCCHAAVLLYCSVYCEKVFTLCFKSKVPFAASRRALLTR